MTSSAREVIFRLSAPVGSRVFVCGDFNDWSPSSHPLIDLSGTGDYFCRVSLSPGIHRYKFLVDGIWCLDPRNQEFQVSGFGRYDNLIEIMPGKIPTK